MIHAALSLLVALAPTPDLSTPEKAAQTFSQYYFTKQYNPNYKLSDEYDALEKKLAQPLYNQEGLAHVEKILKDRIVSRKRYQTLSWSHKIVQTSTNPDGTATADVTVTARQNRFDYKTKKTTVVERELLWKFVFEDSGGKWMVRDLYHPCYSCYSKGHCGTCKGTGMWGYGKGPKRRCYSCKGGGTCKYCKGAKIRKKKFDESHKYTIVSIKGTKTQSVDTTSPTGTTKGYLQARALRQRIMSHQRLSFYKTQLAEQRQYFSPTTMAVIDKAYAEATRTSDARHKKFQAEMTLREVEIKGADTAYAKLLYKSQSKYIKPYEMRIVLKKEGDAWLIAQVQNACYSCKAVASCRWCKGSGMQRGRTCWSCKGSGNCATCKGVGWQRRKY